jgi:hypothetical protein
MTQKPAFASLLKLLRGRAAKTTRSVSQAVRTFVCFASFCENLFGIRRQKESSQHAKSSPARSHIFALLSPALVGKKLRRGKLPEVA